jgi:membrane protein DedA with SNARE-associated domain/membrane-associated phospholipid phosphatase
VSRVPISGEWIRRGLLAAAILAFLLLRDLLPDFSLEAFVKDLSEQLGSWTYLLVGALAFLETGAFVGLVAPGEFTVMLGGAVAGQGVISLPLILAITWLCAFLGDTVSFVLGARLGRGFMVRHGGRFGITDQRLRQVENYFARYGGRTILIGRFIGLVRALAPFIAGTSNMRYSAFAPYSVLGTGLWATAFILVGYFFSQSLDRVTELVGTGLLVFGFFVGAVVGIVVIVRFFRKPANRRRVAEAMERRPVLRPLIGLARRVRPQAVFLGRRLTPGGLGLELTTLMAVLAVGLFVLISYWSIVAADPASTGGDRAALELFDDIRANWLDDLAEVVTKLGSSYVVFPLAALCAIALAVTRRWVELCVLLIGLALTIELTQAIKVWVDRPRPPDELVDANGSSFPSGHAAYSTFYAWLGATVALRLVPGFTRRSLLITAGIVLAATVGITRAYLRVHWLSDVTAGWALGVSAFSVTAAVALVVVHIRHNLGRHGAAPKRSRGADPGARH